MKKGLSIFLVVAMMFALVGCGQETSTPEQGAEETPSAITITDMHGRDVVLEGQINSFISNRFEVAELIFSVVGEGAVDNVLAVGKTKSVEIVKAIYEKKYPQMESMSFVGGGKGDLDVEAIIALNPDLFIANITDPESLSETIAALEKADIPTVLLDVESDPMENPQLAIKLLGQIFDQQERADEIAEFIDSQFQVVEDKRLYEKDQKPTVYVEKGSGSATDFDVTFTSGGWADIIELAGGKNIAADLVADSTQIDPEYLLDSNPDFIILPYSLGFGAELDEVNSVFTEYLKRTGWGQLKAVQNNELYELSHSQSRDQFCFFPTLMLSKLFHPEEMAEVEPLDVLKEYFERYMLIDYSEGIWFNAID